MTRIEVLKVLVKMLRESARSAKEEELQAIYLRKIKEYERELKRIGE